MPTQTDSLLFDQAVSVLGNVRARLEQILARLRQEGASEDERRPVADLFEGVSALHTKGQQLAQQYKGMVKRPGFPPIPPRFGGR